MTVPTLTAPPPACGDCQDTGFKTVVKGNYSGAELCPCKGLPHWYRFRPKPRFSSTRFSRGHQLGPKKPWLYFQWTGNAIEAQRFAQNANPKTGIEFEIVSMERPAKLGKTVSKLGSVDFYMENL